MAEVEVALVLVVVAGLEAVVAVVVVVAGLEAVVGAFGAAVGLWANATEAVAQSAANVFNTCVGLIGGDLVEARRGASSFA
jgi:hypothetical protein